MTSLDDLERTILGEARAFIEPDVADENRVFTKLSGHLGLSSVATVSRIDDAKRGSFAVLRRFMATRKAVALSCTFLGAGIGFGAGFLTGRTSGRAEVPAQHVVANAPLAVASASPAAATVSLVEDTASKAAVTVERNSSSAVRPRLSAVAASTAASEQVAGDALGEEVALLKRAERAIRSRNALLALGLLRALDQRYPKGKLLDERAAARVMANCLQLEPIAARQAGEAYLNVAPNNVYHERVRQLCGLTEVTPNKNADPTEKVSVPAGD